MSWQAIQSAPAASAARCFLFERDTFAFANELIWEYRFAPAAGRATTHWNKPPPSYAHHCFVLVRSARQFLYHARFDSTQPQADVETYGRLIRTVVARNPRHPSPPDKRVVIPGYDSLRAFSIAQEPVLKAHCGGAWQSYFLRSHWRIVLPMTRRHQARMARQLVSSFESRLAPIAHLVRFPRLTINHGIVLMDWSETPTELRFTAYDPNQPGQPTELSFDREQRTFFFPRNHYWPGGRVDVIEAYRGGLY